MTLEVVEVSLLAAEEQGDAIVGREERTSGMFFAVRPTNPLLHKP